MNQLRNKLFYFCWIGWGTFLAGAINICAIVLFGMTITHYTGNISNAAIALGRGEILIFIKLLSYIILFFIGSIIAGLLYHEQKPGISKYNAIIPILFGIILLVSFELISNNAVFLGIFAFGMGIKNGAYIKIRGVLIRTTHMTGYLTDAAFSIGAVIRGHHEEAWKLYFYLLSIFNFFVGGVVSTIIIKLIGIRAIEVLAILYILNGVLVSYGIAAGIQDDIILNRQGFLDERKVYY